MKFIIGFEHCAGKQSSQRNLPQERDATAIIAEDQCFHFPLRMGFFLRKIIKIDKINIF